MTMRTCTRTIRIAIAVLLSTPTMGTSAAQVYRCELAGAGIRYQQQPCTDHDSGTRLRVHDQRTPEQIKQARLQVTQDHADAKRLERERISNDKQAWRQHRYAGALTVPPAEGLSHPDRKDASTKRRAQTGERSSVAFESKDRDFRAVYRPAKTQGKSGEAVRVAGQP